MEIDYLEEQDGTVNVFELKMEFKSTLSRSIYRNLPSKTMAVIHPENYWEWLE